MAPLVKIYPRLFPWNSGPLRTPGPGTLGQKRRRSVDRRASERASERLVGQVKVKLSRKSSERANCVCQPWQVVARRKASAVQRTDPKPFLIHDPLSLSLSLSASSRDPRITMCAPRARFTVGGPAREFFLNRLPSLDE